MYDVSNQSNKIEHGSPLPCLANQANAAADGKSRTTSLASEASF